MQYRINIVEDEHNLNDLVCAYFRKEGYLATSFYKFEDAIKHVSDDVHIWLLDIMLETGDGFQLMEEIKNHNPNVPIIFITARDHELDRIIGFEKGCDDYITKPFSTKELLLRVSTILKRVYKESDGIIETDGYKIFLNKHQVFEKDKEIELTSKEYELLLFFLKNRSAAFSREYILKSVWGNNFYGTDRVVDDTLRRLRKKMPRLNVQTIYGYGYRLD